MYIIGSTIIITFLASDYFGYCMLKKMINQQKIDKLDIILWMFLKGFSLTVFMYLLLMMH